MGKFKPELWNESVFEEFEKCIPKPRFERVKYYRLKKIINKIFRTNFKLYQRNEETGKIRILRR